MYRYYYSLLGVTISYDVGFLCFCYKHDYIVTRWKTLQKKISRRRSFLVALWIVIIGLLRKSFIKKYPILYVIYSIYKILKDVQKNENENVNCNSLYDNIFFIVIYNAIKNNHRNLIFTLNTYVDVFSNIVLFP